MLPLKNFCDIARIITLSAKDIEWQNILNRSREYKVLRPVTLVLVLVRKLLGVTAISEDVVDTLNGESYRDVFEVCVVREFIFAARNQQKNHLPFWAVDLTTQTTIRGKIKIFLDMPGLVATLYNARYYRSSQPSVIRTIAKISWYYIKKIARTVALWIFFPRNTRQLHQAMASRNVKTSQMIDWLRK